MKLTFSSPLAPAEFSKFADILSAALSQHHLSGSGIAPLEFYHCWEPVRNSAHDKGHEEGGSAYAKAGASFRSPAGNSRGYTPKPRVCLLSADRKSTAGDEGPHLGDHGGVSGWFSSGGPRVRFLTRYDGEVSEPLVGRQGSRVSMRVARGSASLLSSHGRVPGTSPG